MKCHCAMCDGDDKEVMQGKRNVMWMTFDGVSAKMTMKFNRPVCQQCADTLIETATKSLYNVQETLLKKIKETEK